MKLAVLGTGKIVKEALFALQFVPNVAVTAIYARPHSAEIGAVLAAQYGIPAVFTDYTHLLQECDADAVYVGLVNNVHSQYARDALLAGKHVILEKPFTGFYTEALELQALSQRLGLFCLEAITVLHGGVLEEMRRSISNIGTPRMLLANFSQYSSRYDDYLAGNIAPAFDLQCYGGALFDLNVYNLHYCIALFGMPEQVKYYPNIGPNGADTSGTLVLAYPGFSAVCTAAKDSDSPCFLQVQGERGWMRMDGKPNVPQKLLVTVSDPGGDSVRDAAGAVVRADRQREYFAPAAGHRMAPEFTEFARIIDTHDSASADRLLSHSVAVMRVLEKARLSAGIEF